MALGITEKHELILRVFEITFELWGVFFCIMAGVASFRGAKRKGELTMGRLVYLELGNALLLLLDSMCYIFRGGDSRLSYYMVRIGNQGNYLVAYALIYLFFWYISIFAHPGDRMVDVLKWICRVSLTAEGLLVVLNPFTKMFYTISPDNIYVRSRFFWCSQIGPVIAMLCIGILIAHCSNKMPKSVRISLNLYLIMPFIGVLIQIRFYGLSWAYMADTIALMVAFFVSYAEHSHNMLAAERELDELQLKVMMSQIQPHFLYNSLNSIYYLCGKDPKKAQEAISEFSDYLRTNLDSLKEEGPVPFEQELNHVENYLKLEQLRFGEDLTIVYDIRDIDFSIPALSIQPLIENSVKYGVGKKRGGGTIWISSMKTKKGHRIIIQDDGVGFDWKAVEAKRRTKAEGKSHIGMENVKKRLETLNGASLSIESIPGSGTTVVIDIKD